MSVTLGPVAAILYRTAAPSNINVIWCETSTSDPNTWTVLDFKAYNGSSWVSLIGASAYQVWLDEGNTGTQQDFLDSLVGNTGASAYEVWLEEGNTGTEQDFLDSIKGVDPADLIRLYGTAGLSGATLTFNQKERSYNNGAPSSASVVLIDETNAIPLSTSLFISNGTKVTSVGALNSEIVEPVLGKQPSGKGVLMVFFDGTQFWPSWRSEANQYSPVSEITSVAYPVVFSDLGNHKRVNNVLDSIITFPLYDAQTFPYSVGVETTFEKMAAGDVTIEGVTGVTILGEPNIKKLSNVIVAKFVAVNVLLLVGGEA